MGVVRKLFAICLLPANGACKESEFSCAVSADCPNVALSGGELIRVSERTLKASVS